MSAPQELRLLRQIDDAFDADLPVVPQRLLVAAVGAFAWRRVDAVLAELSFDSLNDELIGVRGTSNERRSMRFSTGDSVVRVHLTDATLTVMIEPPRSVECRIVSGDQIARARTDEMGEVVVDAPPLPLRLEVDHPSGQVVTPWITG